MKPSTLFSTGKVSLIVFLISWHKIKRKFLAHFVYPFLMNVCGHSILCKSDSILGILGFRPFLTWWLESSLKAVLLVSIRRSLHINSSVSPVTVLVNYVHH